MKVFSSPDFNQGNVFYIKNTQRKSLSTKWIGFFNFKLFKKIILDSQLLLKIFKGAGVFLWIKFYYWFKSRPYFE